MQKCSFQACLLKGRKCHINLQWACEAKLRAKETAFHLKDRKIWKPQKKMSKLGYYSSLTFFLSQEALLQIADPWRTVSFQGWMKAEKDWAKQPLPRHSQINSLWWTNTWQVNYTTGRSKFKSQQKQRTMKKKYGLWNNCSKGQAQANIQRWKGSKLVPGKNTESIS